MEPVAFGRGQNGEEKSEGPQDCLERPVVRHPIGREVFTHAQQQNKKSSLPPYLSQPARFIEQFLPESQLRATDAL